MGHLLARYYCPTVQRQIPSAKQRPFRYTGGDAKVAAAAKPGQRF